MIQVAAARYARCPRVALRVDFHKLHLLGDDTTVDALAVMAAPGYLPFGMSAPKCSRPKSLGQKWLGSSEGDQAM